MDGLFLYLAGAALFLLLGGLWKTAPLLKMGDFKAVYYASQALINHRDPYSETNLLTIYRSAHENNPAFPASSLHGVTACVNLPATLLFLAPIALLPWGAAHWVWFALIAASYLIAAYLMWDAGN